MIEAHDLTKRYGDIVAVDHLSFSVRPGVVTAFLGPNGAGKTTTMRLVLGLDRPSGGSVTVAGRAYRELPAPMREVGALLEARAVDGVRSARAHLTWLAHAGGIPISRVAEVLEMVGLTDVAGQRIDGYSLGMSQRLGRCSKPPAPASRPNPTGPCRSWASTTPASANSRPRPELCCTSSPRNAPRSRRCSWTSPATASS
ncbi:MAG: ATP-binding cassette domain-containing protein, partial [Acidimicrobiales bacterium]